MKSRSLIINAMISTMLIVGAWVGVSIGALNPPTIELEQAVHFLSPGGEDVVIEPGLYEVEQAEEWLRVLPGSRQDAVLIQADVNPHDEKLTEPLALSVPGEEADYKIPRFLR